MLSYFHVNQPYTSYLILFFLLIPIQNSSLLTQNLRSLFKNHTTGYRKSHSSSTTKKKKIMATASATTPATITVVGSSSVGSTRGRKANVQFIRGLNSFNGLKAQNSVTSLGLPVCTEQAFAKVVSSLKYPSKGKGRSGGAASSTCNAAGEIFQIAAIMNGLTLVGVAVGFILLRIEAFVEEAE